MDQQQELERQRVENEKYQAAENLVVEIIDKVVHVCDSVIIEDYIEENLAENIAENVTENKKDVGLNRIISIFILIEFLFNFPVSKIK